MALRLSDEVPDAVREWSAETPTPVTPPPPARAFRVFLTDDSVLPVRVCRMVVVARSEHLARARVKQRLLSWEGRWGIAEVEEVVL